MSKVRQRFLLILILSVIGFLGRVQLLGAYSNLIFSASFTAIIALGIVYTIVEDRNIL